MKLINDGTNLKKRRQLRKKQTPEEETMWQLLRKNKSGLKWRRQVSIGYYIVDFYCHSKKVALEIDGLHHTTEKGVEYDSVRSKFFSTRGIKTIRILNSEIQNSETLSTLVERVVHCVNRVRIG
ncbi:MAG: endonuclease domain-containing protein [bacterium]